MGPGLSTLLTTLEHLIMSCAMPTETFSLPTYIVLDLPSSVSAEVLALRRRFDLTQAKLPPEITLAGSSGLGTVAQGQDLSDVFSSLECVAQRHAPFSCRFESVRRFPGTAIFWLGPCDRKPFDALHRSLLHSGIRFTQSHFAFTPHCTISATSELSSRQEAELYASPVPQLEFVLDVLGVYEVVEGQARMLRSFALEG